MSEDTRIVAIRAGFEVLLGKGDKLGPMRLALSEILEGKNPRRTPRKYTEAQTGHEVTKHMTDLEWWYTQLSFLRNRIMHGAAIAPAEYVFGGERQLWLGEARLRKAIKTVVANETNQPELLLDGFERALRRAAGKVVDFFGL
jgi:hypothetical protein